MNNVDIPQLLKRIRKERKWTQRELANEVGYSQAQVNHWETGYSSISMENLIAIAEKLNMTVRIGMGGNDIDVELVPAVETNANGRPLDWPDDPDEWKGLISETYALVGALHSRMDEQIELLRSIRDALTNKKASPDEVKPDVEDAALATLQKKKRRAQAAMAADTAGPLEEGRDSTPKTPRSDPASPGDE